VNDCTLTIQIIKQAGKMNSRSKRGERIFVPQPRASYPAQPKKSGWLNTGTAIILISVIVAILIGAFFAL